MKELKKQHLEMLQLLESIEVMFQNGDSIHPNSVIRGAIQTAIGMEIDVTNVNDKCDNKQTAVEWLVLHLNKQEWFTHKQKQTIEQAKEMEKEQMIEFGNDLIAQNDPNYIGFPNLAEQYYNETFKSE